MLSWYVNGFDFRWPCGETRSHKSSPNFNVSSLKVSPLKKGKNLIFHGLIYFLNLRM